MAGADRGGRAAGRAAGRVLEVVRIARLARVEIGALGGDRLAEDHRARGAQHASPRPRRRAACGPCAARVPFSVGMSAVSMMSFTPTGTPCSGPSGSPLRLRSSSARACASACSSSRNCQACTFGSSARMRSRQALHQLLRGQHARRGSCARPRQPRASTGAQRAYSTLRQPQPDPREDVEQDERDDLDAHERHHAARRSGSASRAAATRPSGRTPPSPPAATGTRSAG